MASVAGRLNIQQQQQLDQPCWVRSHAVRLLHSLHPATCAGSEEVNDRSWLMSLGQVILLTWFSASSMRHFLSPVRKKASHFVPCPIHMIAPDGLASNQSPSSLPTRNPIRFLLGFSFHQRGSQVLCPKVYSSTHWKDFSLQCSLRVNPEWGCSEGTTYFLNLLPHTKPTPL